MSSSPARILVFAYSDLGHACLKLLLDRRENVVAVFTHEDTPGENLWFPSVAELARTHGVPVETPEKISSPESMQQVAQLKPDLILSFYYRYMIPDKILKMPKLGAYNMHGSLLPKFRGRAPVNWAVLKGEKETGPTLHVMEVKADAGDIVDQEAVPIGPDDTAAMVQVRVTQAAVKILNRQIENLKKGAAPRRKQNIHQGSYFGRRGPEDGRIDWTRPAAEIHNLIRAVTHPYPGAYADIRGAKTYIWLSRPAETPPAALKPGELLFQNGKLLVGCGLKTALEILRIQTDGRQEVTGAEFANMIRG